MQRKRLEEKRRKQTDAARKRHVEIIRRKARPLRRRFKPGPRGQLGHFVPVWPPPRKRMMRRRERLAHALHKKAIWRTRWRFLLLLLVVVTIVSIIGFLLWRMVGES